MSSQDFKSSEAQSGELGEVHLVELLGRAYAGKLTGRLDLARGRQKKEIYFFNGMPVFASSQTASENLLEVMIQFKGLGPDDALQLRTLQRERHLPPSDLVRLLGLVSDAELYALEVETCTQIMLEACGWSDGSFQFRAGEDRLAQVPCFDLNPLELIYQGIKTHHALDLARTLREVEGKKARLRHGWERSLALPRVYFERSDVLDLFEREMLIGESIPRLYQEFGDLGEAMLFLYLLLVTGILEMVEPSPSAPEPAGRSAVELIEEFYPEAELVEELEETFYFSVSPVREEVGPTSRPPDPEDYEERAEAEAQGSRVAEAERLLQEYERKFEKALDHFELLGIEVDGDYETIQTAFDKAWRELSLPDLPQELRDRQERLLDELDRSYQMITDPDERIQYEQTLFYKRQQRTTTLIMKQKLALEQWRRGQWYLECANRPDLARRCFQQALELDPRKPHFYAYVGWACYRKKDIAENRAEALDYLNQALRLAPHYDQAHYFLGVIKKREGDQAGARRHFEEAIRVNPDHRQARREFHLLETHAKQDGIKSWLFGKKT